MKRAWVKTALFLKIPKPARSSTETFFCKLNLRNTNMQTNIHYLAHSPSGLFSDRLHQVLYEQAFVGRDATT